MIDGPFRKRLDDVVTALSQIQPLDAVNIIDRTKIPAPGLAARTVWGRPLTEASYPFNPSEKPPQQTPTEILNMTDWVPFRWDIGTKAELSNVISSLAGSPVPMDSKPIWKPDGYQKILLRLGIDLRMVVDVLWELSQNPAGWSASNTLMQMDFGSAEQLLLQHYPAFGKEHKAFLHYVLLTSFPRLRRFANFCFSWACTETKNGSQLPVRSGYNRRLHGSTMYNDIERLNSLAKRSLLEAEVGLLKRPRPRGLNGVTPKELVELYKLSGPLNHTYDLIERQLTLQQKTKLLDHLKALRVEVKRQQSRITSINGIRKRAYANVCNAAGLNPNGAKSAHSFRHWAAGQSMVSLLSAFIFELLQVGSAIDRFFDDQAVHNHATDSYRFFGKAEPRQKPLPQLTPNSCSVGEVTEDVVNIAAELLESFQWALGDPDRGKNEDNAPLATRFLHYLYVEVEWDLSDRIVVDNAQRYIAWMWTNLYCRFGIFGPLTQAYTPEAEFRV